MDFRFSTQLVDVHGPSVMIAVGLVLVHEALRRRDLSRPAAPRGSVIYAWLLAGLALGFVASAQITTEGSRAIARGAGLAATAGAGAMGLLLGWASERYWAASGAPASGEDSSSS